LRRVAVVTVRRDEFRTSDPGEAEQHLRRNYGDVALDGTELAYEETSIGDDRLALGELRVSGEYAATADVAAITIAESSRGYRWQVGDERGDAAHPVLFQPGAPMSCQVRDAHVRVVVLPLPALTEMARTVYNDDTLTVRFERSEPTSPAMLRAWRAASAIAFDSTADLGNELVRASVVRTLAVTTLEAFGLAGDRPGRAASARQQLAAYRRAVAFLDDHASLPITIDDAATAAGVSTADLHRAFRSYATPGRTPEGHLGAVRLDAAHADLLHGRGPSVRAIALRWGFSERALVRRHLEVYGVDPHDLLV
jgi:AraC-like DNA-binding protein